MVQVIVTLILVDVIIAAGIHLDMIAVIGLGMMDVELGVEEFVLQINIA